MNVFYRLRISKIIGYYMFSTVSRVWMNKVASEESNISKTNLTNTPSEWINSFRYLLLIIII